METELISGVQTNTFRPQNFQVIVDGNSEINYHGNAITTPTFTTSASKTFFKGKPVNVPGDSVEYSPLSFRFVLDEDWNNYYFLLNWMLSSIKDSDDVKDLTVILYNNKNNPVMEFTFIDCFVSSLNEVDMDVQDEAGNVIVSTVIEFNDFRVRQI